MQVLYPRLVRWLNYINQSLSSECFAVTIVTSPRYLAMKELVSVHGVGPVKARRLYDLGLRNVDDLRNYYGVDLNGDLEDTESQSLDDVEDKERDEIGIRAALRVYDDINTLYVLPDIFSFVILFVTFLA